MDFNSSPTRMVWLARTLSLITPTQGIKVTCYPKFQNRYCVKIYRFNTITTNRSIEIIGIRSQRFMQAYATKNELGYLPISLCKIRYYLDHIQVDLIITPQIYSYSSSI